MNVVVVGMGPGSSSQLTLENIEYIKNADLIMTSNKRIETIKEYNNKVKFATISETVDYINKNYQNNENLVIAASGDVGFYSIATTIKNRIREEMKLTLSPGISSMTYFLSRIGKGYEKAKLVSLHGRKGLLCPYVNYNPSVFALTGGETKVAQILKQLKEAGFGDELTIFVGENLTFPEEKITKGKLKDLEGKTFDSLAVIYVENEKAQNPYRVLKDSDFLRGKIPMTKEAIRNLSISALEIQPKDVVYDVGAGTGSVTCAAALKAFESTVYAIEKKEAAYNLVRENIEHTSIRNIHLILGDAPDGMEDFPPPDKVFIGGSTGRASQIIDLCLEKNPKAVFVVTAIALETIASTLSLFKEKDFNVETMCVTSAISEKLGRYHLMKGENPVYIIKGMKNYEDKERNS